MYKVVIVIKDTEDSVEVEFNRDGYPQQKELKERKLTDAQLIYEALIEFPTICRTVGEWPEPIKE